MNRRFAAVLLAAAALPALGQGAEDRWTFAITPYLWLPNVNGTLSYSTPSGNTGSPVANAGPNDYLENLEAVLMLAGEARNGRWLALADVIYLDFAKQKSTVKAVNFGGSLVDTSLNASTSSSLKGMSWTLAGGYAALEGPQATLDVIGGVRYLGIKVATDWELTAAVAGPLGGQVFPQAGSISEKGDLYDVVVGVRGRARLGASNWYLPYYLDFGAGSSSRTAQALLGVSYHFGWGDLQFAYRYLSFDEKEGKLLQELRFAGPAVGAVFRF